MDSPAPCSSSAQTDAPQQTRCRKQHSGALGLYVLTGLLPALVCAVMAYLHTGSLWLALAAYMGVGNLFIAATALLVATWRSGARSGGPRAC